ncbi:MAG: hypothetical protein M1138_01575 [Candidatus Thermoplasmatota archaeon]|jgi:heme/copper-type cytochrome/quinol oxidase subunit 2|nr:hypothetical protein [Candidatus Thermoplasmatota archaeon]MCL5793509.1 hypothetical protein [Candidatus Thermoplasmatota archaeon]
MMSKGKIETVFMAMVIVVLAVFAVANYAAIMQTKGSIAQDASPVTNASGEVIHVIGHQWAWTFIYPNGTQAENNLVVTVNTRITLIVNSSDVIHDLYIPQMDIQSYAVPGQNNTVSFTPTSTGQFFFECVEYCGEFHYEMRGYLTVIS